MTMTTHVSAMCRAAYYQLRQLRPLIRSLSFDAAKLLVQSFISTRQSNDYCIGSTTTCTNAYKPLKTPQHASSPTQEGASTSRPSCSSYTLASSPPTCSIQYRRADVQGTAQPLAAYLAEDCQLLSVTGHRRLRSSDIDKCLVPRINTRFGDRSFAVAGPRVCNSLPTQLRESDTTLGQLRRALKTHIFGH